MARLGIPALGRSGGDCALCDGHRQPWPLGSARASAWAGVTLATSFFFFEVGHSVLVDMTLTATVTFALGMAFLALAEPHLRGGWLPWFWVGVGLTFLAKGVVGPVMVLVPVTLTFILERDWPLFRAWMAWNWGMLAALLLTAGWVGLLWDRGGTHFLVEVFLRNSLGRFSQHPDLVPMTGALGEHVEPWYYYLFRAPANVLPITFLHLALWLDRRSAEPRRARDAPLSWTMGVTLGLVCLVATAFPWFLVREAGVSPMVAVAGGLLSLVLTVWSANRLRRRDLPAAFNGAILQWILFLAVVIRFGVPALDRQNWVPLEAPYRLALALSQQGAGIACAGLNETQLGFSSLTFHQVIPVLESPDQLQAMLDQAGPVAVLVEPGWWAQARALGVRGVVVPTQADTLPSPRKFRAPVLVINREPTWPGR